MWRGKADRRYSAQLAVSREEGVKETTDAAVKKSKSSSSLTQVNDYAIVRKLGQGAYGTVYEAALKGGSETLIGKLTSTAVSAASTVVRAAEQVTGAELSSAKEGQVAIKGLNRSVLKRKRVGRFGSAYDSVLGEIAVMKQLNHPNIVKLYEVIDDPDEDLLFMVVELVRGGDLSGPIEDKRHVPEAELRVWMRDLMLGLEHLHHCGVCHRDIKPENVLWDPDAQCAKLSDFGISGFFRSSMLGGDFFNATSGSLPFFAPEMCRTLKGAGYSGRAADLWACGCSLFMWMYHRLPYEADNPPALLAMIAEEPVAFPPNERGHSAELLALLHGLLTRAPKERVRIKDVRKDPFLTQHGSAPFPEAAMADGASTRVTRREELSSAIQRVALMRAAAETPSAAPAPAEAQLPPEPPPPAPPPEG